MYKKSLFTLLVFTLSFGVGYYVLSWTEPGAVPPDGNVTMPINVSTTAQYKQGDLGVGVSAVPSAVRVEIKNTADTILRLTRDTADYSTDFKLGVDSALLINSGNYDTLTLKSGMSASGRRGRAKN